MRHRIRTLSFLLFVSAAIAAPPCSPVLTVFVWGGENTAQRAQDMCNASDCSPLCQEWCGAGAWYGDYCSAGQLCGQWQGSDAYCSSGICHCLEPQIE